MDILISSNLERLLYLIAGTEKTKKYMDDLARYGKYTLLCEDFAKIKESFVGYFADEQKTRETIKEVYENKNYLIDTHTSVAVSAASEYKRTYEAERKILIASTASPYKFARDVYLSLVSDKAQRPTDVEALSELSILTGTEIPSPLAKTLTKKALHDDIIDREGMDNAVMDFAKA
jgi:threonine synthase